MKFEIVQADYGNPRHARDLVQLLDAYARDPMGGGHALPEPVRERVVQGLAARAHAFSILAYADGQPAGLVNCFEGYSTFYARPLVNIHDIVVLTPWRGSGLAQQLLQRVQEMAQARGSCKLTLEVLGGNARAQAAYRRFGFQAYALDSEAGLAQFWQKLLPADAGASAAPADRPTSP